MDRNEKPGIDVDGWLKLACVLGLMWAIMMFKSFKEYFVLNGMELAKFVFCLLMTVIIWMAHVWKQSRSWEDYGDEVWDKALEFAIRHAEQLIKATPAGKLMETYNIGMGEGGEGEEVIGG